MAEEAEKKASEITSIMQVFPCIAICQICKESKATKFAEVKNPEDGLGIYKFVCVGCSTKHARRPAVDILKFFSSPRVTVATLAHMDENGTNWGSFGNMMYDFCSSTGCFDTVIA